MNRKITKLGSWLLAFALLLSSMLPITASAASGVTMDLTNCHVSWDYTLTDEDGNAFTAAYGVSAEDNPFGGAVSPAVRKMFGFDKPIADPANYDAQGQPLKRREKDRGDAR